MALKERARSHINEEKSFEIFKGLLPEEWVYRKYSPDYGIDYSVELFKKVDGKYLTQGEYIYVQLKSVENLTHTDMKIYKRYNIEKIPLCKPKKGGVPFIKINVIKFVIDTSLLETIEKMGSSVPVLLILVDLARQDAYFVCLNDYIEKVITPVNPQYYKQKTITINLPTENRLTSKMGKHVIEWYAKRAKLFSFFNKVAYQYHELQLDNVDKDLARHFSNILSRLDAWSASKFWPALDIIKDDFFFFHEHGYPPNLKGALSNLSRSGHDVNAKEWEDDVSIGETSLSESMNRMLTLEIWRVMDNIGRIFEDITKEADLPTYSGYDLGMDKS